MRSLINLLLALPAVLAAPIVHQVRDADVIEGSWIVRIQDDAALSSVLTSVTSLLGVQPAQTFEIGSFKGFSINGVNDAVNLLSALPSIAAIEPNTRVYTNAIVSQSNPPYGLARISHRTPGASTYDYDSSAGAGTFSYGIDTGILTSHPDFEGRAIFGKSFVDGEQEGDGNGHGTHTAGTMGATTYGVAKKTTLIAVKVLSAEGSGSNDGVLAGIAWAANDAKTKGRIGKAVANLSLGGLFSPMTNQGAAAAVEQGLFLAVAAGNSGLPTITASPASEKTVCTVGATDSTDTKASFSNFGAKVDIFAPGVNVTSTWNDGKTKTISGTSMAAPHVAGLGAYLLALEGPRDPIALCNRIRQVATKGVVKSPGLLSPNLLAYNLAHG